MEYFLFISAVVETVFYKLMYLSVVASIIGLIIFAVTRIFKNKFSPKWVSRLWLFFIISLIIPMQFKSAVSIYNIFPEDLGIMFNNITKSQEAYHEKDALEELPHALDTFLKGDINTGKLNEKEAQNLKQKFDEDFEKIANPPLKEKVISLLPAIWICVLLILTTLYIMVYINFILKIKKAEKQDERLNQILENCKKEMNIKRKIKIIYQNVINMPSIFGLFKIKILINEDAKKLTDKELSYIIKHELAHYKRRDNWLNFLITIFRNVYIFNPIIFILLGKVKKDLELATDELAMKKSSNEEQKEYLKTLVILSENKSDKFVTQTLCLSDEKKNLERRIDSLKLFDMFKKNSKKIAFLSIVLVLVLITTCFSRNNTYMTPRDLGNFLSSKNNYNKTNYIVRETNFNEEGIIDATSQIYKKDNKFKKIDNFTDEKGVLATSILYDNLDDESQKIYTKENELGEKIVNVPAWGAYDHPYVDNTIRIEMLNNTYGYFGYHYHYYGIENVNGKNCYKIGNTYEYPSSITEEYEIGHGKRQSKYWIDIETGLIMKEESGVYENNKKTYFFTCVEYEYEFGTVTDDDVALPDLSKFKEGPLDYYVGILDFYTEKEKIINNTENSKQALDDFSMLENLPDSEWRYSYSNEYYKIDNEFVYDFIFNSYNNDEYYKMTIRQVDDKILKLEKGINDEDGNTLSVTNTVNY